MMRTKEDVFVVGVGMTHFGNRPEASVKDLTREAVNEALSDAQVPKTAIDVAFFGNTMQGFLEGQTSVPGQIALRSMGFEGVPVVNVENACATASTAFYLALTQLRAGMADVALAVGAEKMSHSDTDRVMQAFEGGMDVHRKSEVMEELFRAAGEEVPTIEGKRTIFMDIYAAFARAHMKAFGTTKEQFAVVASKNHQHSTLNERCHFTKAMSVAEVLSGRALAFPLTVPMCSPMSDGAAAALLCTERGLARLEEAAPVRVRACQLGGGIDRDTRPLDWSQHIAHRTAVAAYEEAGVAPSDISVAEVHDATAVGEVIQSECLQLCEFGEGGRFAESRASTLGGRLPINPSGGLESRGHPIGATGLAQIYELVTQLRGRAGKRQVADARLAIAENGGGLYGIEEASCMITILEGMN